MAQAVRHHNAALATTVDDGLPLARSIRLGNPLDPSTEMGPLTSTVHRDRVHRRWPRMAAYYAMIDGPYPKFEMR